MKTRLALLLALGFAAGLTAAGAHAADAPPRRRTLNIAPGTPATVGQGGAVAGVVPHQAVPAPRGAMSTFGGLLGTRAPRSATGGANPSPAPR